MVFSFLWQFAIFSLSGRFSLDPSTPAPAQPDPATDRRQRHPLVAFSSDFLLAPEKCLESFTDSLFASVCGRVKWPVNRLRNATVSRIPTPRRRARVRRYNRAVFVKSCKTTSRFEGGGRGQEGEWGELALTEKRAVGVKLSNQPSPPIVV